MSPKKSLPDDFEKDLISKYLKYNSIENVFRTFRYDLPISFASYHRLLNKYGVIKSAGPNSKFSESLHILSLMGDYKIPLERVIHQYAPHNLKVSINTVHRILHYTRLGITRRVGTALLVSPQSDPGKFLIAIDNSLTNNQLGQAGDYSLPMGHSKMQESAKTAITRVLQQEMFTQNTIAGQFPQELVPVNPKPIFFINIADIKVAVYRLLLPSQYDTFSSFKLSNYQFTSPEDLTNLKIRPGVMEIIQKYQEIRFSPQKSEVPTINSSLNQLLYAYAEEPNQPSV